MPPEKTLTQEQLDYRSRQLNPQDEIGKKVIIHRSRQLNPKDPINKQTNVSTPKKGNNMPKSSPRPINGPSTTGNISGKGRGNLPPKK